VITRVPALDLGPPPSFSAFSSVPYPSLPSTHTMPLSPEDFLRTCFVSNPPVEAHTGFTDAQGKAAHIDIDVIWPAQWGPEPFEDGLRCIRYHDVSFCTEGSSGGYNS
jgi:hypothetical protein